MADRDKYRSVIRKIEEGGFFVSTVEKISGFDRITAVAKERDEGGFHGNSFWITKIGSHWFFGTWGGSLYEMPCEDVVAEFAIRWFTIEPDRTCADFTDELTTEFGLQRITEEEFDAALYQEK